MQRLSSAMAYEERKYRDVAGAEGFVRSEVVVDESDLLILAKSDARAFAERILRDVRAELVAYIARDPGFTEALAPRELLSGAPRIAVEMAESAARFGVGPMAAVAGAVAERVGEAVAREFGDAIVENGGDIFVSSQREVAFGFYAGEKSPFTGRMRFKVAGIGERFGVCTSSGTVGHSLSFGRADAVTVVCESAADADAAATAIANLVIEASDIDRAIAEARKFNEIKGVIAAKDDRIGIWGAIEII
ncbi:MAG TPA: UPF0280 family protein [bacterium]|nr:UPF0280 family protein [bacterium]